MIKTSLICFLFLWMCGSFVAADGTPPEVDAESQKYIDLVPAHQLKKRPGPYDWLAHHPEPGQSYADFLRLNHPAPDDQHNTIYIMLVGDFDPLRAKIVTQTAEFMNAFYGLPVKFMKPLPLSVIPETAKRVHPQTGDHQILSTYVIEDVLIPRRPDDAYTLIAFVSSDLWPGEGWNFVFGQASLDDRVGVWSIYRNGDPSQSEEAYQLALLRTIKTGLHEIGHMFGMHHCTYFECLMNGSNHRIETDERPVYLCPVDLRKLIHLTGMDPVQRYERLEDLSRDLGFDDLADAFVRFKKVFVGGFNDIKTGTGLLQRDK